MVDGSETLHGPVRMWLTVFTGPVPTQTLEVRGPRFLIGRDEACDLVIDDPKVSKEHAMIVPGPGPFRVIQDLGSANGTLVNGQPLRPSTGFARADVRAAEISGGEWLHFGDTAVRVMLVDPQSLPEQTQMVPPPGTDSPE